jgi:hypothetical protein
MNKPIHEYWLHVHENGEEERFNSDPSPFPSLRVKVFEVNNDLIVEETYTVTLHHYDVEVDGDHQMTAVHPRGEGWVLYDNSSDNFSVWRRLAKRQRLIQDFGKRITIDDYLKEVSR